MTELHVCAHCGRHIRATESRCPFCSSAVTPTSPRSSAASVLFAVAAAATVAACYGGPQRNIQQQAPQQQPATQPPTGPSTAPAPSTQPSATPDATSSRAQPGAIGAARMLADRTLVLELNGSDLRDSIGAGEFRYPTVHPQYDEILAHVGPIEPGQRRSVREF